MKDEGHIPELALTIVRGIFLMPASSIELLASPVFGLDGVIFMWGQRQLGAPLGQQIR